MTKNQLLMVTCYECDTCKMYSPITSVRCTGCGSPFPEKPAAEPKAPLPPKYEVTGLPEGWSYSPETGTISGVAEKAGQFQIGLRVVDPHPVRLGDDPSLEFGYPCAVCGQRFREWVFRDRHEFRCKGAENRPAEPT